MAFHVINIFLSKIDISFHFVSLFRGFASWIDGAEAKCKTGYGSPNSLEEATKMLDDCKAWRESTASVCASLETGKASADKMTLHGEQDKLYTEMKARWVEVDKSCKEWSVKLDELSGMWTKQTGEVECVIVHNNTS